MLGDQSGIGGEHSTGMQPPRERSSKKEKIKQAASSIAHAVKEKASGVREAASQPQHYTNVPEEDDSGYVSYKFPDKAGACDYALHAPRSVQCFFKRLVANFGWRFALMIGTNYLCVKGLLLGVTGGVRLSYCKKTLRIDGTQCQLMGAISATPWAIKGAIGVVSDAYPLLGYHKSSYILCVAVVGTAAFALLAGLDISSPTMASVLFFFTNFEIATCDLLCEGKYAEKMQEKPKTGSTMVSYVWGLIQFGSLVAALFVGPIADAYNPQVIFWFCVPLAASVVVPTFLGYLGDQRVTNDRRGIDWPLLRKHPYVVAYSLIMAACAFGNGAVGVTMFDSHTAQVVYAVGAAVLLSVLAFLWLPRQLAMCNFYMFLSSVLYINIGGAQDFWFTADESCVPGGPAFDYTYYNTYTAVVGAFTGWIGILVFQAFMSGWNFRTLFWVTTLVQVVASGFDMVMISRWNVALGISDKVFYMFGDAVIAPAVGMFSAMPGLVLTSKLVPKGLESTTYALLAGFQNFGGVVSSQIGIYATQAAGIKSTVPCNFDQLNTLVGVCHCLLPLLAVPLTFILIPDKKMTDSFVTSEDELGGGASDYREQTDEDDDDDDTKGDIELAMLHEPLHSPKAE